MRLGARATAAFDGGLGVDGVYQRAGAPGRCTALARLVVVLDRDVVDAYVRGTAVATRWAGVGAERAHTAPAARHGPGLGRCAACSPSALVGVALW